MMGVAAALSPPDEPSLTWDDGGQVDVDNPWPELAAFEERDAAFFHGRDAEIKDLVRALLSNRFTLILGKSGLGKSSLIKAGCFPRLRGQGILPVYVRLDYADERRSFSAQLRAAFLDAATQAHAAFTPWAEERSAWEYLHDKRTELWSAKNRPLSALFVFDQFEEMFTKGRSGQAARQMFAELSDLVEGRVPEEVRQHLDGDSDSPAQLTCREHDYRVLMSMREDYLAELEEHRTEMPSMSTRRIRLAPLGIEQARTVVTTSGKRFVSEDVSTRIVQAVARAARAERQLDQELEIDPALLCLFCRQLNNRRLRRALRNGNRDEAITRGDVETNRAEILKQFYERCLTDLPPFVAAFVEDKLLTESGHRDTEPLENAKRAGLTDDMIRKLVKRRLLRLGEWSGAQRLELTHDVLTEVVKAAREERLRREEIAREARERAERELREAREQAEAAAREAERLAQEAERQREQARIRQRERRLYTFAACVAGGALMLFGVATLVMKYRQEVATIRKLVYDPLEELAKLQGQERDARAPAVFDQAASYLWNANRREQLFEVLKKYEALIPDDYGLESVPGGSFSEEPSDWPLTLEYSSSDGTAALNHQRLLDRWSKLVEVLRTRTGVMVPSRPRLAPQPELLPGQVRLVTWPKMSCPKSATQGATSPAKLTPKALDEFLKSQRQVSSNPLRGPHQEGHSLLSAQQVPAVLQEVFRRYKGPKAQLPDWLGDWYLVPRWTRPLWRVVGGATLSYEAGLAMVSVNELLNQPELALSCDSLRSILRPVERGAPKALREALAARGDLEGLRGDLIAVLRARQSLRPLRSVLDALADYPRGGSPPVSTVLTDLTLATRGTTLLQGPSHAVPDLPLADPDRAYLVSLSGLNQELESEARVYLGATLSRYVAPGGGALADGVQQRLAEQRRALFLALGVMAPDVAFRDARQHGIELAPDSTRIEVGAEHDRAPLRVDGTSSERVLAELTREIGRKLEAQPSWWINADSVSTTISGVRPRLRSWLEKHYSLNDLKNVLRDVVGDGTATTQQQGGHIRDVDWLLGALVFWKAALQTSSDARKLASALRATQRARALDPGSERSAGPVGGAIAQGVRALGEDDLDLAERSFKRALELDPAQAEAHFLRSYAEQVTPALRAKRLTQTFSLPNLSEVYDPERAQRDANPDGRRPRLARRFQIDELLDDAVLPVDQVRALRLEKLRDLLEEGNTGQPARELVTELLTSAFQDAWSPEERLWFGVFGLRVWRDNIQPPDKLDALQRLLSSAIGQLGDNAAVQVVSAGTGSNAAWIGALWHELAKQHASEPSVVLQFAFSLARGGLERARRAHELLTALESDTRPAAKEIHTSPYLTLAFLQSDLTQAMDGPPEAKMRHVDDLRRRAEKLCFEGRPELSSGACGALIASWVLQGNLDGAQAVIDRLGPELSKDVAGSVFMVELARGRLTEAARADASTASSSFQSALIALLQDDPGYDAPARRFLYGPVEDYQDYIRVIYWARLMREGRARNAKDLLDERMGAIDRSTWTARLQKGELGPWREMLVAYCADLLPARDLFEPLSSPSAFAASPLSQTDYTRRAFQVEGYLYDALKQRVSGSAESRERRYAGRLNDAVDTGYALFYEYHIARMLSKRVPSAP